MAADQLLVLCVGIGGYFCLGWGGHQKLDAVDGWSFLSNVNTVVQLCNRRVGGWVEGGQSLYCETFGIFRVTLKVSYALRQN